MLFFSSLPGTSPRYITTVPPGDPSSSLSFIRSWSDTDTGARTRRLSRTSRRRTPARYFYWSNSTNIQSDSNHRTRRIQQTETQLPLRQYTSTTVRRSFLQVRAHASFPTAFVSQRTPLSRFYVSNDVKIGGDFSLTKKKKKKKNRERERNI